MQLRQVKPISKAGKIAPYGLGLESAATSIAAFTGSFPFKLFVLMEKLSDYNDE